MSSSTSSSSSRRVWAPIVRPAMDRHSFGHLIMHGQGFFRRSDGMVDAVFIGDDNNRRERGDEKKMVYIIDAGEDILWVRAPLVTTAEELRRKLVPLWPGEKENVQGWGLFGYMNLEYIEDVTRKCLGTTIPLSAHDAYWEGNEWQGDEESPYGAT